MYSNENRIFVSNVDKMRVANRVIIKILNYGKEYNKTLCRI